MSTLFDINKTKRYCEVQFEFYMNNDWSKCFLQDAINKMTNRDQMIIDMGQHYDIQI